MSLPLRKQGNSACAIVVLVKKKKKGLIRYFSKIHEQSNSFFHFYRWENKKQGQVGLVS